MWIWLLGSGIVSIGYGIWRILEQKEAWDSEESMAIYRDQIDHHREEFLNQFRLSQEALESIYAEDLTDMKQQLGEVTRQLVQLQRFLQEQEWNRRLEGATQSPQKKSQLKEIWRLEQEGYTDEEIASLLHMGIGEVLLLKQFYN